MKRFIITNVVLLLGIVSLWAGPNPIVRRLSQQEIIENTTPSAVAYNTVCAILQKDWDKMRSYMSNDAMIFYTDANMQKEYEEYGINSLEDYFSTGRWAILNWREALYGEYEVAIAYVQDLWYYEEDGSLYCSADQIVEDGMIYLPDEEAPRVGINEKRVYVSCSPSSEINRVGFQEISRYEDMSFKVIFRKVNDKWVVVGFK